MLWEGVGFDEEKRLSKRMFLESVLKPIIMLLEAYISRSGEQFEMSRKVAAVKHAQGTTTQAPEAGGLMRYVLLVDEEAFRRSLQATLSVSSWSWLPSSSQTLALQSLVFHLTSRFAALVFDSLIFPCRHCPFKTFQLLHHPEGSTALEALLGCIKDDFAFAFLKKYPSEAKLSPAAAATLWTIATAPR